MTAITKKAISNRIKERRTPGDWALDIFKVLFLAVITIITVYPFWNIFVVSINDATDAVRGGIYFWPRVFSTASYGEILGRSTFQHSILVTLARTVIGTPLAVMCTAMLAYPLSRKDLVGHKFWSLLFVFTMYFGGGQVPYYMVLKNLGLLDNFWVFILPNVMSVYNMILIRSYIDSMPSSLFEAVRIDGGNDLVIFFKIILPLSYKDVLIAATFVFMSNISSFTTPYLIGASQRKMLGVYLREQFGRGKYEIAAATSVIIFLLCSISAIVYLYTNMKEQAWEEN